MFDCSEQNRSVGIAQEMGLQVFGTIKLLIMAKEQGLLTSIRAEMDKLAKAGFRLSKALYEEILEKYEPPVQ